MNTNNQEALVQADGCIHMRRKECTILEKGYQCQYKTNGCSFHQTREEADASLAHYNELMNAKPSEVQKCYADKYHGGKMPWKEGVETL